MTDQLTNPMTNQATGQLLVELNPPRIQTEPGAAPVEATVTIQNLGDVVEQYSVEVSGLDSDWFTAPVASVGLFPQDKEQVRITFHPPKRQGMRSGAYPFQVVVRGRSGVQERSVDGVLDVRGFAVFRMDMTPRRQTSRGNGRYRIQLTNSGTADVQIGLEARDAEDACQFTFPDQAPAVAAGKKAEAQLIVRPHSRPWVGPETSYEFTVTAKPQDARGQPQTVSGQFTYRPLLPSWAPVRRFAFWAAVVLVGLMVLSIGLSTALPASFGRSFQIAGGRVCGTLYRVPVLNSIVCRSGPMAMPVADSNCAFDLGFKEFTESHAQLTGRCTTRVAYDGFGNGLQYASNGILFWQKNSDTIYFFTSDSVYAYLEGKPQLLHGPGQR